MSLLFLLVGELEQTVLERWDAEALALRLDRRSVLGLRVQFERSDGEGDLDVLTRGIPRVLRFAFSWP